MLPVPGGRPAGPARWFVIRPRPKWAAGPRLSPPPGTLAVPLIHASAAPPAPVPCPGRRLDTPPGAERWWGRPHVQAPPADAHRSRYRPRHPGGRTGPGTRCAADHRGGHRGAAGVPGRVLPLAAARDRSRGGAPARRWRADPAQRAPGVAVPPRTTAAGGHTRMNSYDVRFWDIKKVSDTAKGRWRVRWGVAGRPHCKSFPARQIAEGFLASLKDAVRDHLPFDLATGLPVTGPEHAAGRRPDLVRARPRLHRSQMAAPGPDLPPVGRRVADHRDGRAGPGPARRPRPRAAAPVPVRVGVQPRHPQLHPAR